MVFTSTELYIFILCVVVFVAFSALLSALIVALLRYYMRLVRLGAEDAAILKEYNNRHKQSRVLNALGFVVNLIVCIALLVAFVSSVSINICERKNCTSAKGTVARVVRSNSMAKAYEKNEYLFQNGLGDPQNNFRLFDVIYTHAIPKEDELKLYDVVVYDLDGAMIIHRIVKIEDPNEKHPDERYYYLQGDNNVVSDPKPVKYEQMRGIWRGEKVEHVGSFVLFMQSPAGYLCIILILCATFILPIAINKVEKVRKERYKALTGIDLFAEERTLRNIQRRGSMTTYYNRPGSPYSVLKQKDNSNYHKSTNSKGGGEQ